MLHEFHKTNFNSLSTKSRVTSPIKRTSASHCSLKGKIENKAMDLGSSRRRGSVPKAGSVWESRMKLDEVKGGINVLIATDENSQNTQNYCTVNAVSTSELDQMDKKSVRPIKSPIGMSGKRKTWKSEGSEGSPLQIARQRSGVSKNLEEKLEFKSPNRTIQLRKSKSDSAEAKSVENFELREVQSEVLEASNENSKSSSRILLVKAKENLKNYDDKEVVDDPKKGLEGFVERNDKNPDGVLKSRSEEECKKSSVREENTAITRQIKFVDEEDGEVEVKNKVQEITVEGQKPEKVVIEEKKLLQNNEKSVHISPLVKKQPFPNGTHPTFRPSSDHFGGIQRTSNTLQSYVDLIMWGDASKSAFVFGIGTFAIISSSYTMNLNISTISVVSYLGLVYLAANFLFRSLVIRESIGEDSINEEYAVGEEEAIRVVKQVLPFVNEFLLKLRALFSGDPATTMKLAVLLFVLAQCGGSITIWKMAKLGFIGVFTLPKICSSYSSQLTAHGKFWIQRFHDAWQSCSHKKAVALAIFALVWKSMSVGTRIWAAFMLFVAFKYYQQSSMIGDESKHATSGDNGSLQEGVDKSGGQRLQIRSSTENQARKV